MARRPGARGDDGFVLLETMVSISLITVIMAALTSLFVTVIRVNSEQRALQVAVQVADSTASYVRSLPTSDLLTGRTAAAVAAQWSSAPNDVQPYLASMEQGLPTLAGGSTVLPMTLPPKVVHGIAYTVDVYLGWCHTAGAAGAVAPTACLTPATVHDQLRAVVAVSWPDRHCATSAAALTPTCSYVSATLISTSGDPVFTLHQPAAAVPGIVLPSFVAFAVGDTVGLDMGVQPGTGVPVFTWRTTSGTWPPGVSMDSTGHVAGTITAQSSTPITVTVTDGFVRTVAATFSWAVLPPLQGTGPVTRDDVLGASIPVLTLGATGGAGGPYTWSDPTGTLPPGLSISAGGVVSGTPTAVAPPYPHVYAVRLTVADTTTTRKATVPIAWTIRYPPLVVTNPGTRTDALGNSVISVQLVATGGQAPYTWSASGLPAGLTMTSAGLVTGTVTSMGTSTPTVTARDQQGTTAPATFSWVVTAAVPPTVTSPGPLTSRVGSPVKIRVASTCAVGPCTYALLNGPTGVTIDGTGLMSSTAIGGAVKSYATAKITVTDNSGATATTAAFTWTVSSQGSISATWPVVTGQGGTPDQPLAYSCQPSQGSATCTVTVTGLPSGIGLSTTAANVATDHPTSLKVSPGSGILWLNGTVATTAARVGSTVTVGITGNAAANDSGTWTVQ